MASSPIDLAFYVSGHGYGHLTRSLNLISLLSTTQKYKFHVRTSSTLYESSLPYQLHPSVIQTNAYQLDGSQSLDSLQTFDHSIAQTAELEFLQKHNIKAILSDAVALPCLLAHSLHIPSILVTNFTFDSIYQALLNDELGNSESKVARQKIIDEMSRQYALSHTVIRLPGYIPFLFRGPQIVDVPMHFRKAKLSRSETLMGLGLQCIQDKKILLHCFGGHGMDAPSNLPRLPDGWVFISQTIDSKPPFFYKIPNQVYMPDLIAACDVVLGKLGWGTCSEVIGNGYKPLVYVPRSAFMEEVGLLEWMKEAHGKIVRLEVEEYEFSEWEAAVEKAYDMRDLETGLEADREGNEAELVRIVGDVLEAALK